MRWEARKASWRK